MNKKKRISIIFVLMLFLFSVFKITEALTSESLLQITNVEILNKSDTVEIIDVDFSKNAVQPKVVHHKIGDTITYKIHIKNKENKNYTIKSIKDNNSNEYISYEYENYEGFKINSQEEFSINIKETYQKEVTDITKRNQTFSIVFTIILEDENNNVEEQQINFNDSARLRTGEYLNLYVVSAGLSFVMLLIFLIKRKSYHYKYEKISLLKNLVKKYITLFSLIFLATLNIVPIISNDIDLESFDFAFQSSINLNDKLIVSCEIDGTTTDLVVDYNKRVELPPDPQKTGYNFNKWVLEDGTDFNINNHITKDIKLKADFIPTKYHISYELNGGTLPDGYPTSYTIETNNFNLKNPTKDGYNFTGWTGSNGSVPQTTVTIQKGSTDDKTYTAHWEPITYTITYDPDGGTLDPTNPIEYTIESETITLNKPTKEGLRFKGWTGSNGESPQTEVKIKKGSIGNKTYTAHWTDEYTIIFHSNTDGEDQTHTQTVKFDQEVQLDENTFTNGNKEFKEWTTNSDGTGVKYINKRVKYTSAAHTETTTVPFNIVNLPVDKNLEIHLYAQWQEPNLTKTTFDKGQNVNVKMKKLAGNNTAKYSDTDTNIKYIKKATSSEFDAVKDLIINNPDNKVTSSYFENYYEKPIYMWFDNGTIYYYSEADIIYLNETNSYLFNGLTELISIDLSGIDSSIVQNMESMFGHCEKLTSLDLRNFNTSAVKTMQYMFNACESLTSLDISSFNTCQVNTMRNMFSSCKNLQTLDITNFNTFNVKNMQKMFDDMYKVTSLDLSSFDTRNVTLMNEMFETASSLESINLSNFDTSKVTTMQKMFNECSSLKSLDLSNFDTRKVTNMGQMFSSCTSLESLDLSGFSYESINISNIIKFNNPNYPNTITNFPALKKLNLTNFDASKVTNMSQMFYGLPELEELNLTNFKTTNATDMASMFAQCTKLKKLDLSSFDTSNVTKMSSMFNNCANLEELDISSFDTSQVTDMNRMFASCDALTELNISSFDTGNVKNMQNMFSDMDNIETIYASNKFVTSAITDNNYGTNMFRDDIKLVGGQGTVYSSSNTNKTYARIDDPDNESPGYFTQKTTSESP